jgi:hypothetical protein
MDYQSSSSKKSKICNTDTKSLKEKFKLEKCSTIQNIKLGPKEIKNFS